MAIRVGAVLDDRLTDLIASFEVDGAGRRSLVVLLMSHTGRHRRDLIIQIIHDIAVDVAVDHAAVHDIAVHGV